jgi:hypothetical protein
MLNGRELTECSMLSSLVAPVKAVSDSAQSLI